MPPTIFTISTSWSPSWRRGSPGAAHHRLALDLTGNNNHSKRIDIRAIDARDGVSRARAGRHVYRRKPVGQLVVTFRGHRAGLLMVAADIFKPLATPDRVVEVHGSPTRDHENMPDAMIGQRLCDIIGQAHHSYFQGRPSPRARSNPSYGGGHARRGGICARRPPDPGCHAHAKKRRGKHQARRAFRLKS